MTLKESIQRHGWKITDLAKAMEISQPSLTQQVNGNPSLANLRKMADIIGCSVSELIGEDVLPQEITILVNGQSHTYTLKPNEEGKD